MGESLGCVSVQWNDKKNAWIVHFLRSANVRFGVMVFDHLVVDNGDTIGLEKAMHIVF